MGKSFLNENSKNSEIKRQLLRRCIDNGDSCIADLSKELNVSVPTTTKLVSELIDEGFLQDNGKVGTSGGRRPNVYGLNPLAGYFIGIDIARHHFHLAISDFKGEIVHYVQDIPFVLEASERSFKQLCDSIRSEVETLEISWDKILGLGMSLSGRVNPEKGYSLTYFVSEDIPITASVSRELGIPVFVDNDSRAMTYAEYMTRPDSNKDMVCINLNWGLGMGMIVDGKLYYGKSGFSGEIGHFPLLNNNIICRCGKIGCLETEASGSALHRMVVEKLQNGRTSMLTDSFKKNGDVELAEILEAIREEDVLAIESIGTIGEVLGKAIAGIINIFNPGLVVIGGRLIVGQDYLRLPIKTAVNKHSLSRVSSDTKIRLSSLGTKAAPVGDCLLARTKLLGLI